MATFHANLKQSFANFKAKYIKSSAAASGGTDLSMVTTGEKYTWNNKASANNAVAQTATTTNANYEVLFSSTADNTTRTEGARKNSNLKFNPSTGNLQITQLNGVTVGSDPKFTDTNTWRPVQNNLTSTSTSDALSANQGRLLANGSARDSTKLPLSGGTMTGSIINGGGNFVKRANNTGSIEFLSGTEYTNGAWLCLRGSGQSGFQGQFELYTGGNGTNSGPSLIGTNTGILQWNGKDLLDWPLINNINGVIAYSTAGDGGFTGIGTATVLRFRNNKCIVFFDYMVTYATTNAGMWTYGLSGSLLADRIAGCSSITPIQGGVLMIEAPSNGAGASGRTWGIKTQDNQMGYGCTLYANGVYWQPARVYEASYNSAVGGWSANQFSLGTRMHGQCIGTWA